MGAMQPGILAPAPASGRFLILGPEPELDPRAALERLASVRLEATLVLGLGEPLVRAAGRALGRLRPFPALCGVGCAFPSTQGALYAFLGGGDAGELLLRGRALLAALGPGYRIEEDVLAYRYAEGRDLSGYEDGTENPKGERALEAGFVAGAGEGLDGSSFVAVQRWIHDLARFEAFSPKERDELIGRKRETNEELTDAPPYAHVKRTAQESFEPPAFMVRRSMPWGDVQEHGLMFVAYAASLDPYEKMLARMAGLEDGVVDGLMRFSRAVSGGHYWCPPVRDGRLDLRALASPLQPLLDEAAGGGSEAT
jgi:putative iron-dependent peroxidase